MKNKRNKAKTDELRREAAELPVSPGADLAEGDAAEPADTDTNDELMKRFLSPEDYEGYLRRKSMMNKTEREASDISGTDIPESAVQNADATPVEAPVDDVEPDTAEAENAAAVPEQVGESENTNTALESDGGEWNADDARREVDFAAGEADEKAEAADIDAGVNAEPSGEKDENGEHVLDDTDMRLMKVFNMDKELADHIGDDAAASFTSEIERESEEYEDTAAAKPHKPAKIKLLPDEEAVEYTDPDQRREILQNYKKRYRMLLIRTLGCAVLAVIAFFLENLAVFGGTIGGALNPSAYPVVYVMAELQLVFFGAALVAPQLLRGIRAAARREITTDSITLTLVAGAVIYHIVLAFIGSFAVAQLSGGIRLYNFPLLICLTLSLVYEYLNLRREVYSFNIVSSKRVKYVITRLDDDDSALERETFQQYLPENAAIFRLGKARFVDGFFTRSNGASQRRRVLRVILPIAGIAALIFAVVGFVLGGFYRGVSYAALAVSAVMPFSLFLTFSYPFFRASHEAFKEDSAIIGEPSLEEYMNASVISFDDRDVFPSTGVMLTGFKACGNTSIDYTIYMTASLFKAVGGPLSDIFELMTKDMDMSHSRQVEIIDAVDGGLEAYIDGTHVFAGRAAYLEENGIEPAYDDEDEIIENDGDINIMYLVIDGEVCAKYHFRYIIDPDFEVTLKQLYKIGMCVGVRTFDPNIDEAMLSRCISVARYPVRIMRCRTIEQSSATVERAESGIVSRESSKSLLSAFSLCDKVIGAVKTDTMLKFAAMGLGAVLCLLSVLFGGGQAMNSLYVALYQLFWIIPTVVIARLGVGKL